MASGYLQICIGFRFELAFSWGLFYYTTKRYFLCNLLQNISAYWLSAMATRAQFYNVDLGGATVDGALHRTRYVLP